MTGLRLYRPSNGTEGEGFFGRFCYQCERDREFREGGDGCPILLRSMLYEPSDPEYPREWTYDEDGEPTCTAFVEEGGKVPTDRELEAAGQATLFGEAT